MDRFRRHTDNDSLGTTLGLEVTHDLHPGTERVSAPTPPDVLALARRYSAALERQLAPGSRARSPAAALGREAVAIGLDRLDLVGMHERALRGFAPDPTSPKNGETGGARGATFLADALALVERAHRGACAERGDLARLGVAMRERSLELDAVHRRLTREVARRETVQRTLETSERHHGRLLQKSLRMQDHLRRLSHEILSSQEEERKKISRELHDEIGQALIAITVQLAALKKETAVNATGFRKRIAGTHRLVERSMTTVHRFARDLRPSVLDDLGLVPALRAFTTDFTKRTRIPVHLTAFAAIEELAGDKRTVLYRVVQEALTNVSRHARASRVRIGIRRAAGFVYLDAHDDGRSFRAERVLLGGMGRRLGILGMRERVEMVGGSFSIESRPGEGTTVRARIPFGERGGRPAGTPR